MAKLLFMFIKSAAYGAGVFFCLVAWAEAECHGGAEETKSLYKKLLADYNPLVRPMRNYSTLTDVTMMLRISLVLKLDTKQQLLYLRGFLRLNWKDEYLQWEPKEYECINHIVVPQNSIWKPDIILYNAANERDSLGNERTLISVNSNGLATWEPPFYLKGTCQMDMTRYIFDASLCPVVISSWMTDNQSMSLSWPDDPINIDSVIFSGEYEVTSGGAMKEVDEYDDQFFEVVTFNIRLAKRPMYVVVSLLVPVNLLAVLAIMSFIVPPEKSEKVAISITFLLSFIVFLAFVDNNIPPSCEHVSFLVIYISTLLLHTFLCAVGNIIIITLKIHDNNWTSILYSNKNESTLQQHASVVKPYKNRPQGSIKIRQGLLESDNCNSLSCKPSHKQISVKKERKYKHKIVYVRATKLNNIFLLISCVTFGVISCLMFVGLVLLP